MCKNMIIGIDLGTTNSLCAYYSDDGAKIIPNRLGKPLTPSVVSVDEQGIVSVGETAREYGLLHPDRAADVFKRFMGTKKEYILGGKSYTAMELSAMVLRKIKEEGVYFAH